ncbi:hypothetical protein DOTSEDRAFT_73276 [Dothistroma septosporum NZE10]|uniref:Zn(2)-C6 fungal-type domain-containing protein n=1 Tax=Dothistroma septosporum (strain NZE10 / CBS 128990) TaxID=675120 RepID=N1PIG2_DOTSN|nr:hypothetical protein DOTSEDRAFT_73276 [Dothistroma septosporum NZE10]
MPAETARSTKPPGTARSNITRRRTGCIPCRDRHVRCDERKPICKRCDRSSTDCVWTRDIKIVFHENPDKPPRRPTLADKTSPPLEQPSNAVGTGLLTPSADVALHEMAIDMATAEFTCPGNPSIDITTSIEVSGNQATGPELLTAFDVLAGSEIATADIANVRSTVTSPAPQPELFTDWAILGASDLVQKALRTDLELTLMKNYIEEVAPWFDAHTGKRYYSRIEVPSMLSCPPWRAAALAISAKNIELREKRILTEGHDSLPLHLYQLAVRLAIESMSGRFERVGTLAGCVLLSVYEMMTVTYDDWRRHVQGCASIYTHNRWNGSTGGLISGCFWDYARIDIWAAFCAQSQTMLPPDTWFDDPETILLMNNVEEDMHSQIAIWLTAKVVNLVATAAPPATDAEFNALYSAMLSWEGMGSVATRPVVVQDANTETDHAFPSILFSTHSSTIGHTMWNSAMVLILEYAAGRRPGEAHVFKAEAYSHALATAGIIETNNHTACLVNSLQPAFIAGRHMRTKSQKFGVLELLAQIEQKTGWKCAWRSDGLREIWNLC